MNCQQGYQPDFFVFLKDILSSGKYDFLLLQEANSEIQKLIRKFETSYSVTKENHQTCIVYKKAFDLEKSFRKNFKYHFGYALGIFKLKERSLALVSFHGHYINPFKRSKEILETKQEILRLSKIEDAILWAGDFNSFIPGEIFLNNKKLSPQLQNISKHIGPTLESKYTEKYSRIGKFSKMALALGINLKIRADHVYANQAFINLKPNINVLSKDGVSDHSPIEIILNA